MTSEKKYLRKSEVSVERVSDCKVTGKLAERGIHLYVFCHVPTPVKS